MIQVTLDDEDRFEEAHDEEIALFLESDIDYLKCKWTTARQAYKNLCDKIADAVLRIIAYKVDKRLSVDSYDKCIIYLRERLGMEQKEHLKTYIEMAMQDVNKIYKLKE